MFTFFYDQKKVHLNKIALDHTQRYLAGYSYGLWYVYRVRHKYGNYQSSM